MAEQNEPREVDAFHPPPKLVEALNQLQNERVFVPTTTDEKVLRAAREHLSRLQPPQFGWKSWLSWAAMAACLTLAAWLVENFTKTDASFAREDINRDGRVDILDAFALARQIENGGTLDLRWDINGDGRVDRADVNAVAARAVSLGQVATADANRSLNERQRDASQSAPAYFGFRRNTDNPRRGHRS